MTVLGFVNLCRKRWLYIVVPLMLAVGAAFLVSKLTPEVFEAEASTYFSLPYAQSANDLFQGANYTQQQLASFATLATTPLVLSPVIDDLDLDTTPKRLKESVAADVSVDTVIIQITAADPNPERAADIANAVAIELSRAVEELSPVGANGKAAIEARIVAEATPPASASQPNTKLNLAAGLLAGLFIGLLAAIGRERLDTRVRTAQDLPHDLALLASVEFDRGARTTPVLPVNSGHMGRAESFRRLRTNLRFADVDRPARLVVVTSSVAGEGKSSTAINLALVCARAGERVVLVDADLRRPRIAEYLGIEGGIGLVDVLAGVVELRDVAQPWSGESLVVIPSGTIPPNPSELLGSQAMSDLLGVIRREYDLVILDTPPLLPVTDAAVLAAIADGALLVSRYAKVTRHEVAAAMETLRAVSARVLGGVLNMIPPQGREYSYYSSAPVNDPVVEPSRPATS